MNTKTEAKPTPTPWEADKWATGYSISGDHSTVCCLGDCNNAEANAKLLVEAVNHHEAHKAAVEALKVLLDHAKETYPHFESERGQRDIAAASAALARLEAGR